MKPEIALPFVLACVAALRGHAQQINPPGIEWQRSFGGDNDDILTALQQTSDGGYILGGWTTSGISGTKDECAVRRTRLVGRPAGRQRERDLAAGLWWDGER